MINILMVEWFARLHKKGIIGTQSTMLELGPQDMLPGFDNLGRILTLHFGAERSAEAMGRIFKAGGYHDQSAALLYRAFGFEHYFSVDKGDARATWQADLNFPLTEIAQKFPVVTNFGTAEHVFNISQVFATCDSLLVENGISLHVLPALADPNHGFWNIHPTVYFDVARDNGYAIEDIVYVDALNYRCDTREKFPVERLTDFGAMPISRAILEGPQATRSMMQQLFSNMDRATCAGYPNYPFDYCFVAMRKLPRAQAMPFQSPTQSIYR